MLVVAMREKVVMSEGEECSLWRLVERVFKFGHREFSDLGIEFPDLSFQIDGVLSCSLVPISNVPNHNHGFAWVWLFGAERELEIRG